VLLRPSLRPGAAAARPLSSFRRSPPFEGGEKAKKKKLKRTYYFHQGVDRITETIHAPLVPYETTRSSDSRHPPLLSSYWRGTRGTRIQTRPLVYFPPSFHPSVFLALSTPRSRSSLSAEKNGAKGSRQKKTLFLSFPFVSSIGIAE
jgi:hypothetical protein